MPPSAPPNVQAKTDRADEVFVQNRSPIPQRTPISGSEHEARAAGRTAELQVDAVVRAEIALEGGQPVAQPQVRLDRRERAPGPPGTHAADEAARQPTH